jgi:hypothetical protein
MREAGANVAWLPRIDLPGVRRGAATFLVLAVLFLAPWPGLPRAFTPVFAGFATVVARVVAGSAPVRPTFTVPAVGQVAPADGGAWAVLYAPDVDAPEDARTPLDTRILGYTPLAMFLALALATRAPRRRKLIILALGLGALMLRLAAAVALPVARSLGALRSGSALAPVAELVWWALLMPPTMSYATPLAIWWALFAWTTPPDAAAPRAVRRRANRRR